jgi:hypothetical protein
MIAAVVVLWITMAAVAVEILDLFPPKQMAIAVGCRPFLTAGMIALAVEFYIFKEVREGNLEMLKRHNELEERISALEKKK